MNYEIVVTLTQRVLVCDADGEEEAKVLALDALGVREAKLEVKHLQTEAEELSARRRVQVASQLSVLGHRVIVERA